jgi:hypothetical protein
MDQAKHQKHDERIFPRFWTIFVTVSPTGVFWSTEELYNIPTQCIESHPVENWVSFTVNTVIMHVLCMLMSRIWFHTDMSSWYTWIKMDIAYSYNIDIHGFIWFCWNLKSWAHRWAAVLHYWWSCWRKDTYTYGEHAKSKAWNWVPYKN